MGARLALKLALEYPQHVRGLVMESGSPGLRTEKEREKRRNLDAIWIQKLQSEPLESVARQWLDQPLFITQDKNIKSRLNHDPKKLIRCLQEWGTGALPSYWDRLPDLSMPTLFVTGDRDQKFCDVAAEMKTLCPHSTHKIIPGAGHNTHLERPEEFAKVLNCFMTEFV